ncbi:hypothetical protein D5086_029590 [Populus alba]|uniref:Uncharacterized protein n=1 Tax=Populus alba TaxID=43335 RepID=A0ACC4AU62_POPAL
MVMSSCKPPSLSPTGVVLADPSALTIGGASLDATLGSPAQNNIVIEISSDVDSFENVQVGNCGSTLSPESGRNLSLASGLVRRPFAPKLDGVTTPSNSTSHCSTLPFLAVTRDADNLISVVSGSYACPARGATPAPSSPSSTSSDANFDTPVKASRKHISPFSLDPLIKAIAMDDHSSNQVILQGASPSSSNAVATIVVASDRAATNRGKKAGLQLFTRLFIDTCSLLLVFYICY